MYCASRQFEEFLELMAARLNSQDTQEELKDAFKTFDIDGNGLAAESVRTHGLISCGCDRYIEADELVRVVTSMGERLSLEEVLELLSLLVVTIVMFSGWCDACRS